MKTLRLILSRALLISGLLLWGALSSQCVSSRAEEDGHGHDHEAHADEDSPGHDDHGHGGDGRSAQITVWTDKIEIGQESRPACLYAGAGREER